MGVLMDLDPWDVLRDIIITWWVAVLLGVAYVAYTAWMR